MSSLSDFIDSWQWGAEYFKAVRPVVVASLQEIRTVAEGIPNPNLREQALSSLTTKQFHCEGGGVFGGPSRDPKGYVLKFLVPYQTLCDYLDTVTDRGPSQDPENLRQLHQSLLDAVTPHAPLRDYYQAHPDKEDGGYIASLVGECQRLLTIFPGYSVVQEAMRQLVSLYIDLQVFKHGPVDDRVPQLEAWYYQHQGSSSPLYWWEFAAATGSTLGLFALLQVSLDPHPSQEVIDALYDVYFPWIGALHILLDYFIDQKEDSLGGDLNFVTYYPHPEVAIERIQYIYQQCIDKTSTVPDGPFHRYVTRGLLGFYLSDRKVRRLNHSTRSLLAKGGSVSIGVWLLSMVGRAP